jgi:hypothetical protein
MLINPSSINAIPVPLIAYVRLSPSRSISPKPYREKEDPPAKMIDGNAMINVMIKDILILELFIICKLINVGQNK